MTEDQTRDRLDDMTIAGEDVIGLLRLVEHTHCDILESATVTEGDSTSPDCVYSISGGDLAVLWGELVAIHKARAILDEALAKI